MSLTARESRYRTAARHAEQARESLYVAATRFRALRDTPDAPEALAALCVAIRRYQRAC